MPKYIKKPIPVDAVQWFKNGDHPQDGEERFADGELYEGKVVRYYGRPDEWGSRLCSECGEQFHKHGWIDVIALMRADSAAAGGRKVCPGDWIVTDAEGEFFPVKGEIFKATYDSELDLPVTALKIGVFSITEERDGSYRIGLDSGEGMQTSGEKMEALIRAFYDREF